MSMPNMGALHSSACHPSLVWAKEPSMPIPRVPPYRILYNNDCSNAVSLISAIPPQG